MAYDAKKHWEKIYQTKKSNEVSWYQEKPQTSLDLINETGIDKNASIIDIGSGDSQLVDCLLALGFKNITLLDVSSTTLEVTRKRLGKRANDIKWVISDLREFDTDDRYDIWHDRAVLHFLTEEEDIKKYVELARRSLNPGGYLIVSTFSTSGPKKCSGLDVRQYTGESMAELFNDFEHIKSFEEEHLTPGGASQIFVFNVFKR